jgi:hypothetical protein
MSITSNEAEYKRLRSYLNPFIKGPTVDALLHALATPSSYLMNSVAAVNDQLYITTASGNYLDQRLADYGITRPASVGLSDDIFAEIGIGIKNRKQVRDLINQLLNSIFGDEFVRASNPARAVEPYHLSDGDTLIINFDQKTTSTVVFSASNFQSIATASAQEVADAITKYLRAKGQTGTAIAKDDGNGAYVEILSDTVGASSSVTVLGGSAQNVLRYDSAVPAGGNASTQWTLSLQPGGFVRYTWSGGANPQLGKVAPGNYVNVFGGGFTSSTDSGSFTITAAVGGTVNNSYFEVLNPLGNSGIITQGSDTAVLFFAPIKKTLLSRNSYAAVYQTKGQLLQIFLPAATQVIRRSRLGSAHLHDAPRGHFTFKANPVAGDRFLVTSGASFVAGTDFAIGSDIESTVINLSSAINSTIDPKDGQAFAQGTSLEFDQLSLNITLTMSYTGAQAITGSGLEGDLISLQPNQPGPYVYDTTQPFTVSTIGSTLTQAVNGSSSRVVSVKDSSQFPDQQGYVILGYGTANQEGPVPYIARPSNSTILISPAYKIKFVHTPGTDISFIESKAPVVITSDGTDYPFYVTGVADGRIYAQNLITSIAATGITIVFTILYPSDQGLGKFGTIYSENPTIWS